MFEQLIRLGWRVVEAGLVLIALCVVLNIILGADSGTFISSVSANAQHLLQSVPPGAFLGLVLILLLYWFFRSRRMD
jgi:hypothetical protein